MISVRPPTEYLLFEKKIMKTVTARSGRVLKWNWKHCQYMKPYKPIKAFEFFFPCCCCFHHILYIWHGLFSNVTLYMKLFCEQMLQTITWVYYETEGLINGFSFFKNKKIFMLNVYCFRSCHYIRKNLYESSNSTKLKQIWAFQVSKASLECIEIAWKLLTNSMWWDSVSRCCCYCESNFNKLLEVVSSKTVLEDEKSLRITWFGDYTSLKRLI